LRIAGCKVPWKRAEQIELFLYRAFLMPRGHALVWHERQRRGRPA
jgi:hypothetical protein